MPMPQIVERLAARARLHHTPCGDGQMVWRQFGAGAPLVLVHGGHGSWMHWIRVIEPLAAHHELWLPDLPGLGDSALPPGEQVPESSAKVLAAAWPILFAERLPHVAAFSFGAHVATLALPHAGNCARGFTIVGSAALGLPMGPLEPFAKERTRMTDEERRAVHAKNLGILMIADTGRIDDAAIDIQAANVRRGRFYSRPFANSAAIRDGLAAVTVPLSAIWGANDQTAWPSVEARYDVLRLHHPELVTRTIPDAGHWVMYEKPDAFVAALTDFIRT